MTHASLTARTRRGPRPANAPSERVRHAVLEAARELVEADGYFGLTVDGLVGRSGISKATIYRWWANRAAVAIDMMVDAYGLPSAVADGAPKDRLREFLNTEAEYLAGPAGAVVAGLVADGLRYPDRGATFERVHRAPRRAEIRRLLAAAGVRSRDLEFAVGMIEGAIYHRLLSRGRALGAHWADRLVQLATAMER
jgi:AcrR family transcriptional regulator